MISQEPTDDLEESIEDDGRIKAEECLDVSISDVKLREFTVNVEKMSGLDQINEDEEEDEDVSYVGAREVVDEEIVQIDSTQGPFNEIPATQEVDVTIVEQTQEDPVYIPETQIFAVPDSSEEEKTMPATPPQELKSRGGRNRLLKEQTKSQSTPVQKSNKRHLSITSSSSSPSVASPVRKSRRESVQKSAVLTPLIRKRTEVSAATPPKVSRLSSRSINTTTPTTTPRQSARSVAVPTPSKASKSVAAPSSPKIKLTSKSITITTPPKALRLSSRLASVTTPTALTPRTKRATTERVNLPVPVVSKIPVKKAPIVKSPTKPIVVVAKTPTRSSVAVPRTTTRSKVAELNEPTSSIRSTASNGTTTRRKQIQDDVQTKKTLTSKEVPKVGSKVLKSSVQPTKVLVEKEIPKVTRTRTKAIDEPAGIRNSPRTRRVTVKK